MQNSLWFVSQESRSVGRNFECRLQPFSPYSDQSSSSNKVDPMCHTTTKLPTVHAMATQYRFLCSCRNLQQFQSSFSWFVDANTGSQIGRKSSASTWCNRRPIRIWSCPSTENSCPKLEDEARQIADGFSLVPKHDFWDLSFPFKSFLLNSR